MSSSASVSLRISVTTRVSARGKVLLCPPNVVNSAMLRNLGKTRTAILTGWAVEPNCRFRYQCDAAFPLSDHADFPELIELVKRVQPRQVYTLHGFAAEFAQTLRELGYDARALSQDEQFSLRLGPDTPARVTSKAPASAPADPAMENRAPASANSFSDLAETCRRIGADTRKLEKVRVLAEYLKTVQGDALAWAATWFTGRPFPATQNKVLQLGWAVLRDALCAVAEVPETAFHSTYLKHSDLGETAAELLQHAANRPSLSLEDVGRLFQELHAARGPLAKRPLLKSAFERCTPAEAKYIVKIITSDLRIGLKEGLVEEAVAAAFGQSPEAVRNSHLLVGDLGETAKLARDGRLATVSLTPFRPIKFMLASPEQTAADIWKRLQGRAGEQPTNQTAIPPAPIENTPAAESTAPPPEPVWLEDKYDGVRCQLHKVGSRVALYSRDLKEVTTTFLDLADSARVLSADVVLDGEIVAMSGDEVLPFAELQRRLGRREGDLFLRDEVPIKFIAFDLLWLNGASLLDRPLRERRELLEGLSPRPASLRSGANHPGRSDTGYRDCFRRRSRPRQ